MLAQAFGVLCLTTHNVWLYLGWFGPRRTALSPQHRNAQNWTNAKHGPQGLVRFLSVSSWDSGLLV